MLPEERDATLAAVIRSRVHGEPLRLEYRLRARTGEVLWFRDQADFVCDEAGRPLFMQGTLIDITVNKLAEQHLAQSQDALRALAAYQERIKENERQRIAREIHDELGGLLTGIKAYISVVGERCRQAGRMPDPLLDDAAALAQDAMDTVRRVIADLRPSVLDQLGIWEALEWYVSQAAQRSCLAYECETDPDAARVELDAERSIMLFRIVQEAMTNVQRHAAASTVRLHVRYADGGVLVALEDDGRGIPAGAQLSRTSWGILGMQERSRSLGGELTLAPRPGSGTVMSLRIPMEERHVA
ncbi:sensory transduction histidine kinase, putative [Ricinus communis]|uniref:Sensory transduction histidine kinase, putative n=1 Tax=Ricinus communis TaxID=3988 RepID=B9TFE8_RICCO|nr:sensory transduction histidine kinase, putative [Ricinus communis]